MSVKFIKKKLICIVNYMTTWLLLKTYSAITSGIKVITDLSILARELLL